MPDAVDRMNSLIAAWGAADRRCLFAEAYRTMTAAMLDALDAGRFDDGTWVRRLLERFAEYYFDAVELNDADLDRCPTVWRQAFDACSDPHLHPVRVLFLGINAHINYDLAFCVAEVLDDWPRLDESQRASRHDDYRKVDSIIRATIDSVQDRVVTPVAPEMHILDVALGPLDEWAFSRIITSWRADTWSDAIALVEAAPLEWPAVRSSIENRAVETADWIRHVGPD